MTARAAPPPKRFRGFISYSRADERVARRLHRALETYRVPQGIAAALAPGRRLGRFFIDHDELAASTRLGPALEGALDDTENLIVIASPLAARSSWVNAEITHFKKSSGKRLLAIIAWGRPHSADAQIECFSPALRYRVDADGTVTDIPDEPLAPDLSKEAFLRALIRLVAGLLDVPFDALWRRERRRRRRRRVMSLAGIFMVTVGLFAAASVALRQFDLQRLTSRSIEISREGWQNAWRPSFFEPALRAAIPALTSDAHCDLNQPIETGACALRLSGLSLLSSVVFGTIPTADQDNIRIDVNDGDADSFQRRMITSDNHVRDIGVSGDGTRIALISTAGELVVLDVASRTSVLHETLGEFRGGEAVALNTAGKICLFTKGGSTLVAVDVESGREIYNANLEGSQPIQEIVSDDDGWLVFDGTILISLDPTFNERWRVETASSDVYKVRPFSRSQRKFVTFDSFEDSIEVFEVRGRQVSDVSGSSIAEGVGQVKALAISPDADLVALGGNGSGGGSQAGGQIVSLQTGNEVARLVGHRGEIYAIDFLADGAFVATGGADFSIRLWDGRQGTERLRLIGHVAPIQDVVVSPDGSWLASASWDGTVRLWSLPDDWATDTYRLREGLCRAERRAGPAVSTALTVQERMASSAFAGRPWNVCAWRGLGTLEGWRQALVVLAVRWLGLNALDYRRPAE